MATIRGPLLRSGLFIFLIFFISVLPHSHTFSHGQGQRKHHHRHPYNLAARQDTKSAINAKIPGPTLSSRPLDAENLVKKALSAVSILNKARLDHPRFNKLEFQPQAFAKELPQMAPSLLEQADALHIDDFGKMSLPGLSRLSASNYDYTIPSELVEAARILAEASPAVKLNDDPTMAIKRLREKYPQKFNDTNTPQQAHIRPNGLEGRIFSLDDMSLTSTKNATSLSNHMKRANPTYWMAGIGQKGNSPFAPSGYKVWRNVKDYGAKGDGVTDDTAAINKAISDGNRCGDNCGSSTIYPAVVYFPQGTYLVSSSVIQYYNTQFLGDPLDYPTILAASSFVGLGVFSSNVYHDGGNGSEWYLNTNNFLRSIRNFKMDIRRTDPNAYIAAIHWQVAQATSLENIEFYMMPTNTTQQGIFMENGSGGFLTNLTFVGGNFGAYFGNQQFTTSHLAFVNCKTALQVHWDWAWTMQDIIVESCQRGIVVVGGAGGPGSTGQSVGSLILVDSIIANTAVGIVTSLFKENSTSFLVQNTGFFNVPTAIKEETQGKTLLNGGNKVLVDSWGFGLLVNSTSGKSTFLSGDNIPTTNRSTSLLAPTGYHLPNLFTRRRPKYIDIGHSQILDVKSLGAKGDSVTDDTAVLNSILERAANLSAVVYIPFGVYILRDTLHVPVGSRIIGQAWPQLMATGPNFEDELHPRPVVQVGLPGDVGIIELQDMMFTVSGPTSGAILMQWNVHQSFQGSAAMWDCHFRVGGAIGSKLQKGDCPKLTNVKNTCKAASMLLHLTPTSSGYFENIWAWVADHDLDIVTQDQIDIYSARGILIESKGPTWLYGTSSEHNVLYQYQVSDAKNLVLAMIQTESPYFQPSPKAPQPFITGLFPNDPTFRHCNPSSTRCAFSYALRILDSTTVYTFGAGLYSWFSGYSQACLQSDDCQDRAVEVEQSSDIWFYNLVTKATIEMISPLGETAILSKNNKNGYLSSILGWLRGPKEIIGPRIFNGFRVYEPNSPALYGLPPVCQTALTETIKCHDTLREFWEPSYHGSTGNATLTDSLCDAGCGASLKQWFDTVGKVCSGYLINDALPTKLGGHIYQGYNETCLRDPNSGKYCNDIIDEFTLVGSVDEMPQNELCSSCYVSKIAMMQSSSYSFYNTYYQHTMELINSKCSKTGSTDLPPSLISRPPPAIPICASGMTYTVGAGDSCDSIALRHNVSSASLYMGNQDLIRNCTGIKQSTKLCLPLSCSTTYSLLPNDTCDSIELENKIPFASLRKFNPWIDLRCTNLQPRSFYHGKILCLSPQAGTFTQTAPIPVETFLPDRYKGYTVYTIPPPQNATIATGTSLKCGKWYTVAEGDTCAKLCVFSSIPSSLFLQANPSLSASNCDQNLRTGVTYCVGPTIDWKVPTEGLPSPTTPFVYTTFTAKPTR